MKAGHSRKRQLLPISLSSNIYMPPTTQLWTHNSSSSQPLTATGMTPQVGASTGSVLTIKNETSYKSPPSSISDLSQHECEEVRGRRPDRESSSTAKAEDDSGDDKDGISGKPRKRKRSRKGLDKNFPCKHDGCGKKYSRAEHLYRHQLNRTSGIADDFSH